MSAQNNYRKRMAMFYALFESENRYFCLAFDDFDAGTGNAMTHIQLKLSICNITTQVSKRSGLHAKRRPLPAISPILIPLPNLSLS